MPRTRDPMDRTSWETAEGYARRLAGRYLDSTDRLAGAVDAVEQLRGLDEDGALSDLIDQAADRVEELGADHEVTETVLRGALLGVPEQGVIVNHGRGNMLVALDDDDPDGDLVIGQADDDDGPGDDDEDLDDEGE